MCLFCVGKEFGIDTLEEVDALVKSTCEGHQKTLSGVLLELAIYQLASSGHPAVQLLSVEEDSK